MYHSLPWGEAHAFMLGRRDYRLYPGRKHTYLVRSYLDYPVRREQGTRAPAPRPALGARGGAGG